MHLIVFPTGPDKPDADHSIRKVDLYDYAILVAADAEDDPTALVTGSSTPETQ
jgi:hypothetical protein